MTGRRSRPWRRLGYLVAAAVNVAVLWIVNVQPGWSDLGFLTDDAERVVALVNVSAVVALVVNLGYLWFDGPRVRTLGDLVTTTAGLVAAARVLQVFPFDLDEPWSTGVRVLLVVAVVGSVIGILTDLVTLVRGDRPSTAAPEQGVRPAG